MKTKLIESYKSGSFKVSMETLHFLREWINHHILEIDMAYKDYFSSK